VNIPFRKKKKCQGLGCPIPGGEATPATMKSNKNQTTRHEEQSERVTLGKIFTNLPGDQKAIWTSPFHIRATDTAWLLPLAAASGVLVGSDQHSRARERSNAIVINRSSAIADGGLAAFAGWPTAMYLWGSLQGAKRPRETGLLAGEALINSLAVNEAFKFAFQRERPTETGGQAEDAAGRQSPDRKCQPVTLTTSRHWSTSGHRVGLPTPGPARGEGAPPTSSLRRA
jgi:hypothetical protein